MRKIRFTRRILCFLVPFMVVFLMHPVRVYADDKEYKVDSAEFEVEYEPDGTAVITEKWAVTYISGNFTRFYKDINNPENNLEHFDRVELISCSVDGREAEASSSIDRVDYHYFYEKNSSRTSDTIHWFLHSSNQTVHYEVKYKIFNSVKLDKHDNAVFCYRFIGDSFPKTVGRTLIKARIPGNTDNVNITCSDGDYFFDGNILTTEAENVSGILKLRVEMDSSEFTGLSRVIDGSHSSGSEQNIDSWIDVVMTIGIIILFLLFPIFFIYRVVKLIIKKLSI